jgi:hypothetical protein
MWGQDNEQFWWFFQKFKKVDFLKIQILKIFWIENLRKLVFRHMKLNLLTKASISCLSHPSMSITTWFMKCFRNCVFAKNYAISENYNIYNYENVQFFIPPMVLQVYQVWIKSELGWFFHWFTWYSTYFEHYLLILRRRYSNGTWYIACELYQLATPGFPILL